MSIDHQYFEYFSLFVHNSGTASNPVGYGSTPGILTTKARILIVLGSSVHSLSSSKTEETSRRLWLLY